MKKLILPIILFTFLSLVISSDAYAQSSDCWKEYSDIKPICDQAALKNSSCTDPDSNSPCHQDSNRLLDKCDQANSTLHTCLGLDKEPWILQSSKPGHLTCGEWKKLMIAGTAKNCVVPLSEISEKILWCLSSFAEISQARGHPVDYVLDFDLNSCNVTEDDLRQIKAGLPLTSGSSGISQSGTNDKGTNNKGKGPSLFNIFGINPYQTWLNIQELVSARAFMATGSLERFTESTVLHGVGKVPTWEKDAKEMGEINKFYDQASERFLKLKGKTGWTDINDTTKKVLIESAKDPVTIKKDSALINLQPQFGENGVLETGSKPMLRLGAVDVIVEPQDGKQFEMQTPNAEIFVIGTKFSVIYDNKKNETIVAVYKGKIGIKTNDGKTVTVSPDGDKPGVVVITQKLSATKLAFAGIVLAAIVGGMIFLLKKWVFKTTFPKKKSSR